MIWFARLLAVSFFLQPLGLRLPGGVPLSGILMIVISASVIFAHLRTGFRKGGGRHFIGLFKRFPAECLLFGYAAWLFADGFLNDFQGNGIALAVYMIFFATVSSLRLRLSDLKSLWILVTVTTSALCLIGAYRYYFGYQGPGSEYTVGVSQLWRWKDYVYFGISYTPSTRNSDFLYFAAAFLGFSYWLGHATRGKVAVGVIWSFSAIPVILSLCRGGWIALGAAIFAAYYSRRGFWLGVGGGLIVAIVLVSVDFAPARFVSQRVIASAVSVFAPVKASGMAGTTGKFSNHERIGILYDGVSRIASNPMGSGATIPKVIDAGLQRYPVHYENLYIDLLVIFGVLGIFPIWFLLIRPVVMALRTKTEPSGLLGMALSVSALLAVFSLFNSLMDFAFFWFLAALSQATILSLRKSQCDSIQ